MNYCLDHSPCPQCRKNGRDKSGNNLAVYSDGHSWCFSCGYSEKNGLVNLKNRLSQSKESDKPKISLPSDLTKELPYNVLQWLGQYDVDQELFSWSPSLQRMIYQVYVENELVFWQGRGFNANQSKYYSVGNPNKLLYFKGEKKDTIVVVEDIISALVVSKVECAMPLWGSHIGPDRVRMLSERFKHLRIWLDKDKAEYSLKTRLNASLYFDSVQSIITDKDPKYYTMNEIKRIFE